MMVVFMALMLMMVSWLCRRRRHCREVTQSCPTLCDPMDCSLPGSTLHGILQARVLEWVAISFSMGVYLPPKPIELCT